VLAARAHAHTTRRAAPPPPAPGRAAPHARLPRTRARLARPPPHRPTRTRASAPSRPPAAPLFPRARARHAATRRRDTKRLPLTLHSDGDFGTASPALVAARPRPQRRVPSPYAPAPVDARTEPRRPHTINAAQGRLAGRRPALTPSTALAAHK
jgi:hypothetical protein